MRRNLLVIIILIHQISISQNFWEGVRLPDSVNKINDIELSPLGEVVICTDQGLYKSLDDGNSWLSFGDLSRFLVTIAYDENIAYVDAWTHLYKSTDYGQTWDSICANPEHTVSLHIIDDSSLFRTVWGGLYKSLDGGYNWIKVYDTSSTHCFYDIIQHDEYLYSSCIAFMNPENNGVYRSLDGGNTWSQHSLDFHGCVPLYIDQNGDLLVGISGGWPMSSNPGLYQSSNPDLGWSNLYSNGEVYSIVQDSFGGLYIGLQSDILPEWGIRYSDDGGQSWESLNAGLYGGTVNKLRINDKGYIYALIFNYPTDTLFKSINPVVGIPDKPIDNNIGLMVYPNPSNGLLKIKTKEEKPLTIIGNLSDITGRVIKSFKLYNNREQSDFIIDISDTRPGTYILLLECNSFKKSIRIIKH